MREDDCKLFQCRIPLVNLQCFWVVCWSLSPVFKLQEWMKHDETTIPIRVERPDVFPFYTDYQTIIQIVCMYWFLIKTFLMVWPAPHAILVSRPRSSWWGLPDAPWTRAPVKVELTCWASGRCEDLWDLESCFTWPKSVYNTIGDKQRN